VWRVEGEKKRSRRTSGGCWRIRNGRPADGKDGEGVGKRPLDKGGKGCTRTKRARAEAPRTGVYVISAWNVWGTGRTGCNRAQGSF